MPATRRQVLRGLIAAPVAASLPGPSQRMATIGEMSALGVALSGCELPVSVLAEMHALVARHGRPTAATGAFERAVERDRRNHGAH